MTKPRGGGVKHVRGYGLWSSARLRPSHIFNLTDWIGSVVIFLSMLTLLEGDIFSRHPISGILSTSGIIHISHLERRYKF